MKDPRGRTTSALISLALAFGSVTAAAQSQMEALDRGVVAIHQPDGKVFVSWRLLGTDPADVAFNVYRITGGSEAERLDFGNFASRPDASPGTTKLNSEPIRNVTWFLDEKPGLHRGVSYVVRTVSGGQEGEPSAAFSLRAGAPPLPYHSIPLQTPEGYAPGDASLGDLDGDGDYEIVLKQEQNPQDNSRTGVTGQTLLQAYTLEGQHLWTINLGPNIREGAHYTQFMVYDLDGDGRAEIACRTADATVDGTGKVLGDANARWTYPQGTTIKTRGRGGQERDTNVSGMVLRGPEFLTIFDGRTGAALASTEYVPQRHPETHSPTPEQMAAIWGDGNGNRVDRFLAAVAYLDGTRPSLVMCRGYYTRATLVAWDWRDGKLTQRWMFDSDAAEETRVYRGQGNHNLSVADVDGDGRDEIIYGAAVIDDNGKGLYSTGWGHGDALHVSDLVVDNPGLEVFNIQERFGPEGANMRDAKTGRAIFTVASVQAGEDGEGPGRACSVNIDPRYPGAESWVAGANITGVYGAHGELLYEKPAGLPTNFAIWWDGDLLRELLDQNFIVKFNPQSESVDTLLIAHDCISANGTKATPAVSADLWGDWREEVIWRTRDGKELRIYTTTIPTRHRITTLMHDRQYRLAIAWQNTAYNQPPHPSFYLDPAAPLPSRPNITVVQTSGRSAR